jgi:hypothetical protein
MFEELELAEFGNRIPSLTFELVADDGPVALGPIAAELAQEVRAAGATQGFHGYVASGGSVRAALEEAAELIGAVLIDDGARLEMRAPGADAVPLRRARECGRRELLRSAAGSVPGEVAITYHDAERDYQAGLQRAVAPAALSGAQVERRALAAVLRAQEAKALAERRLDALWAGRMSGTVECGWATAGLRPGTLLMLEGESGRWRVSRWTLGDMRVKLELVREAPLAASAIAASPGRPTTQPDLVHGPTILRLYDLPLGEVGGGEAALAVLAAGTSAGWRTAELSMSFDGGGSWQDLGGAAAPAVLGAAVTALPAGGSALFDHQAAVEIELLHDAMELEARDENALVAGANLALIGAELVQFGAVEQRGPRRYRLSRLLRGRRGTEWAAGTHQAGEDFALIEAGSVRTIDLPAGAAAGAPVMVLASGAADGEPAAAQLVAAAEALRPPAPVHLRAEAQSDGGVLISWVRRSRLGWGWTSGSDTPLGEESERYQVEVAGAGGARRVEVAESRFLHEAAARAADGPGPYTVTVVQLGTHGRSRPATIIIG